MFEWFAQESAFAAETTNDQQQREIWLRLAGLWMSAAMPCRHGESDDLHMQTGATPPASSEHPTAAAVIKGSPVTVDGGAALGPWAVSCGVKAEFSCPAMGRRLFKGRFEVPRSKKAARDLARPVGRCRPFFEGNAKDPSVYERQLRAAADRIGHEIVAVYRDAGISGSNGRTSPLSSMPCKRTQEAPVRTAVPRLRLRGWTGGGAELLGGRWSRRCFAAGHLCGFLSELHSLGIDNYTRDPAAWAC